MSVSESVLMLLTENYTKKLALLAKTTACQSWHVF